MRLTAGLVVCSIALSCCLVVPSVVSASGTSVDMAVVKDAKAALEQGNVIPVLKWVKADNEVEICEAFNKALAVRTKGVDAKEVADKYFAETLVRLHDAVDGSVFAGIKALAPKVKPGIAEADKALESGSIDELMKQATIAVSGGIQERFNRALDKKKHADESIDAGREFVSAYAEYLRYLEEMFQALPPLPPPVKK